MNTAIIILSSLLSGIVGVIISTFYYRKYERRKEKIDTLRKLLGNRHDLVGQEFTEALNSIIIVFHDSKNVIDKLIKLHDLTSEPSKDSLKINDALIDLFKALTKDVNLSYEGLNDNFYLKTFNTKNITN